MMVEEVSVESSIGDESRQLVKKDYGEISINVEIILSKRLKDTEMGQREILSLIENISSEVENLSKSDSERCSSAEKETPT